MRKLVNKVKPWSLIIGLVLGGFFLSVFILVLIFDMMDYGISFAAISATIFLIFTSRKKNEICFKNLLGSYLLASLAVVLAGMINERNKVVSITFLVLALISMVALKIFHAPAFGFVFYYIFRDIDIRAFLITLLLIFALIAISKSIRHVLYNRENFKVFNKKMIRFRFRKRERPRYYLIKVKNGVLIQKKDAS